MYEIHEILTLNYLIFFFSTGLVISDAQQRGGPTLSVIATAAKQTVLISGCIFKKKRKEKKRKNKKK